MAREALDWEACEELIRRNGIVVERPKGSPHPRYPESVYPLDYGYVPNTVGGDGAEVDVFVGGVENGLTGAIETRDTQKGDRELKLLWNVSEGELEAALRWTNSGSMSGRLIRRHLGGHAA